MTTATTPRTADAIVPSARMGLGFFELMLKDIPAEKFARTPDGVQTNHPAWIVGHLSIYPDTVLELIGAGDRAEPDEAFTELFKNGSPCVDDKDGSVYPPKDELVARFLARFNTALDAVAQADDATLAQPNDGFASETMPTAGAVVNFLLGHHVMMHMGQISAWRRMMGMGSAT